MMYGLLTLLGKKRKKSTPEILPGVLVFREPAQPNPQRRHSSLKSGGGWETP